MIPPTDLSLDEGEGWQDDLEGKQKFLAATSAAEGASTDVSMTHNDVAAKLLKRIEEKASGSPVLVCIQALRKVMQNDRFDWEHGVTDHLAIASLRRELKKHATAEELEESGITQFLDTCEAQRKIPLILLADSEKHGATLRAWGGTSSHLLLAAIISVLDSSTLGKVLSRVDELKQQQFPKPDAHVPNNIVEPFAVSVLRAVEVLIRAIAFETRAKQAVQAIVDANGQANRQKMDAFDVSVRTAAGLCVFGPDREAPAVEHLSAVILLLGTACQFDVVAVVEFFKDLHVRSGLKPHLPREPTKWPCAAVLDSLTHFVAKHDQADARMAALMIDAKAPLHFPFQTASASFFQQKSSDKKDAKKKKGKEEAEEKKKKKKKKRDSDDDSDDDDTDSDEEETKRPKKRSKNTPSSTTPKSSPGARPPTVPSSSSIRTPSQRKQAAECMKKLEQQKNNDKCLEAEWSSSSSTAASPKKPKSNEQKLKESEADFFEKDIKAEEEQEEKEKKKKKDAEQDKH